MILARDRDAVRYPPSPSQSPSMNEVSHRPSARIKGLGRATFVITSLSVIALAALAVSVFSTYSSDDPSDRGLRSVLGSPLELPLPKPSGTRLS